jgi:hypothetical protein
MTRLDVPTGKTPLPAVLPQSIVSAKWQICKALVGFRGVGFGSCDQGGDEGSEQGFAASARVVHELEEAEVERQLVLRDAALARCRGAGAARSAAATRSPRWC